MKRQIGGGIWVDDKVVLLSNIQGPYVIWPNPQNAVTTRGPRRCREHITSTADIYEAQKGLGQF